MAKPTSPLDPKGYYRLLKVSPSVDQDELKLAYAMAKRSASGSYLTRLEEAWGVLKHRASREAYDKASVQREASLLKSPVTLGAAIVLLVGAFAILWLPEMRLRNKSFSTGHSLVTISGERPFGKVVRFDPSHQFQSGSTGPAYLVKVAETGAEQWFPAIDLQSTCK